MQLLPARVLTRVVCGDTQPSPALYTPVLRLITLAENPMLILEWVRLSDGPLILGGLNRGTFTVPAA